MPQLLFKRKFFDAIRGGRKTTTLRRWKSTALHRGVRATTRGLGVLKILDCSRVELEDLKQSDARADGFESLQALHEVLRWIYPDHQNDGRQWYKVKFKLESEKGPAAKKRGSKAGLRGQKERLAERIQAELDKAVRRKGSLLSL
jgi:hypothetical protein